MVKDGIYVGEVTLRGRALTTGSNSKVSVLEIGEHLLRDVQVDEYMMNFLDRAAERRGVAVIGVQQGAVIAIGQNGVTIDDLEAIENATKRFMWLFWILFFCAAFTLFLAPITVPLGLWFAFVSLPRRRRKLIKLIHEVQATTVSLKESIN